MIEFGYTLQRAREAKGLSIAAIAESTHMLPQQVEDLEHENFSRIAAPIYGRGFVKLYCEAVGIDPKPLVAEFMDIYNGNRAPTIRMRKSAPSAAAVQARQPEADKAAAPMPSPAPEPVPAPEPPAPPPEPQPAAQPAPQAAQTPQAPFVQPAAPVREEPAQTPAAAPRPQQPSPLPPSGPEEAPIADEPLSGIISAAASPRPAASDPVKTYSSASSSQGFRLVADTVPAAARTIGAPQKSSRTGAREPLRGGAQGQPALRPLRDFSSAEPIWRISLLLVVVGVICYFLYVFGAKIYRAATNAPAPEPVQIAPAEPAVPAVDTPPAPPKEDSAAPQSKPSDAAAPRQPREPLPVPPLYFD